MTTEKKHRGRPAQSDADIRARQQEISRVALRLYQSEGFDAISMRRIGKELGLSSMAIYRYFPSKSDILSTLWGHVLEQAFAEVRAAARRAGSPSESLYAASQAYVAYWFDHRDHYHLVFMAPGVSRSEVSAFVTRLETVAHYDLFFDMLARAIGVDRADPDIKVRGDGLICHLHGIVHSQITMPGYPWTHRDRLVAGAVGAVLGDV